MTLTADPTTARSNAPTAVTWAAEIPSLAAQSVSAENASSPWSSTTTYVTVVPSATSFACIAASLVAREKSGTRMSAVLSACSSRDRVAATGSHTSLGCWSWRRSGWAPRGGPTRR